MSKEEKQACLSKLTDELQKSPLVSNVFIGFILTALEKIVDVDYVCPCDPAWNVYAYAFFVVPSVLAFLLMRNIQGCKSSIIDCFYSFVPVIEWLFLVFMDGNYFVCASTTWFGEYVSVSEATSLRWCEPVNKNLSRPLLIESQQWFYKSQIVGLGIITVFTILYFVLSVWMWCATGKCKEQNQGVGPSDPRLPTNNQETGV